MVPNFKKPKKILVNALCVNFVFHLAFQCRVERLSMLCSQGRNCEHNYDDCLLNPCPEAFSCVDGINKVSCLPPVTDPVPLTTVVKNITGGYTPRAPTPTLSPAPTAELTTGMDPAVHSWRCFQLWEVACWPGILARSPPPNFREEGTLHLFYSYHNQQLFRLVFYRIIVSCKELDMIITVNGNPNIFHV